MKGLAVRMSLSAVALAFVLAFGSRPALAQYTPAAPQSAPAAPTAAPVATSPAMTGAFPAGGLTADDVATWLRSLGYEAQMTTLRDGSHEIRSASSGINFYVHFYDCHGPRCASLQFYAGFNTHGTFDVVKANTWNSTERWVRVHSDRRNDPWLEMDVDLYPGGNYVLLKDEFTVWRDMLGHFTKYINFGK